MFNEERGTNLWNPLYQGKIFEQEDVCTVPMRFPGQPSPLCKEGGDFSSSSGNLVTFAGADNTVGVGGIDNNGEIVVNLKCLILTLLLIH